MLTCGICAMVINVIEYFKPGELMKMMCYSMNDAGKLGKRKSECSYQESNLIVVYVA